MTPAYGSLYSLQFYHVTVLRCTRTLCGGAGEEHCHKNPIVTIIVGIYPLSFHGASAVNVYPLKNDLPVPIGGVAICTNKKCDQHVLGCTVAHVCCISACAIWLNLGGWHGKPIKTIKMLQKVQ